MTASSSPQIVTLPNGLKIIAAQRPYGKTFAAVLTFRVGSYDDPAGIPGLAHFCEHLAFRGENIGIAEKLASAGAYINAFTAPEYTQFIAVGHVNHLETGLVCLSNALQNLPLTKNDITAEREIFRHELTEVAEPSQREAKRESFLRTILGDPNWRISRKKQLKGIRRLTLENVDAFIKSRYHPGNACLSIVAPISQDELIEDAKRLFSKPPSGSITVAKSIQRVDQNRQLSICVDPFSYVWIDVFHIIDQADPLTRIAANLVAYLTGGGCHSALFRQLRTERSLAYNVQADSLPYLSRTATHCFCSLPSRSVHKALELILDHHQRIAKFGITTEQLEAERQRMIQGHEMSMDSPGDLAAFLAYEGIRPAAEGIIDPELYLDRLSSLSLSEVNLAVAKLLSAENRYIFIGGRVGLISRIRLQRRLKAYFV